MEIGKKGKKLIVSHSGLTLSFKDKKNQMTKLSGIVEFLTTITIPSRM